MSDHRGMVNHRRVLIYSAIENYASTALSLISMVVLSRLLLPSEIGTYVVGFAIASLVQSLRDFGTSSYLVQSEPTPEVIRAAFGIAFVGSTAAGLGILASSHALAQFYSNEGLSEVLKLCAILAFLQPIGLPARALLRRELDFKTLCLINTTASTIGLVATVALAVTGASYTSAPLGAIVTSVISIVLLTFHMPAYVLVRPSFQGWRPIATFGGYATGTSLLADVGMRAPDYVVSKVLGFAEVAVYSRAQGILGPITNLIVRPFMPAVLPMLARAHRDGADVSALYLRLTSLYVVLVWPAFGLAALGMPDIVHVVLGPKWVESAPIAQVLCVGLMVWAPTALSGDLFTATGHVRVAFRRELAIQPARVLAVYAAAQYSLIIVAASQILVHTYSLVITQGLLFRSLGIGWMSVVRAILKSAGVSLACMTLPFVLITSGALSGNYPLINLLVLVTIGGAGWIIAVLLFRHPALELIGTTVNRLAGLRSSPSQNAN